MLDIVLDELRLRLAKLAHPMRLTLEIVSVNESLIAAAFLTNRPSAALTLVLPHKYLELLATDLTVAVFPTT